MVLDQAVWIQALAQGHYAVPFISFHTNLFVQMIYLDVHLIFWRATVFA